MGAYPRYRYRDQLEDEDKEPARTMIMTNSPEFTLAAVLAALVYFDRGFNRERLPTDQGCGAKVGRSCGFRRKKVASHSGNLYS